MEQEEIISSVSRLASALTENNRLLQDQAKATGTDRPNKTIAPVAPSDQVRGNQSSFTNMDDSGNKSNVYKYWEVAKQVLGPLLGGNKLPDSRSESDGIETALRDQTSLIEQSNLSSTKTSSMLEKVAKTTTTQPEQPPALNSEKTVVKQASRVIVSDLDDKATKKFGGFFKGLKSMLGMGKKKESTVKKEDDGMGIMGMLGVLAVGAIALLLAPLLGGLALGIAGIVGTFKAAVAVGKAAWAGLKWAGEGIMKAGEWGWQKLKDGWSWFRKTFTFDNMKKGWDKLGKFASEKWTAFKTGARNLADTVSKKFTGAVDYVKTSRIGKAVGGLMDRFTGLFKKKPPGLDKAAAKTASKVGGSLLASTAAAVPKGGKLAGMIGKTLRVAGPIGAIVATGMSALEGVSAATEEYRKSGSLVKATKVGFAGFIDSMSFGFFDKDKLVESWDGIYNNITGIFSNGLDGLGKLFSGDFSGAAAKVKENISLAGDTVVKVFAPVADGLSRTGKFLSDGAKSVWNSVSGFFTNSPEVWDILDESGETLSTGAQKVNASTKKASDNMLTTYVKNHPLATLGKMGVDSFKNIYSKISGWFGDSEAKIEKETSSADHTSKDLLNTQINAIHGITGSVIEVLDREGPTMRSAAIDMMTCAREYFESTEANIKSKRISTGDVTTDNDKDSLRASAINNQESSAAETKQHGGLVDYMKADRTSVDPDTGKLRTYEHGLFGKRYRDLTDDELADFDAKHNINKVSKTPPASKTKPTELPGNKIAPQKSKTPELIKSKEITSDRRLKLSTPASPELSSTAVATKLTELIAVAEQQLQAIKHSNEQSQLVAQQLNDTASKAKSNNTIVNNSNSSTSVINNSNGLSTYRSRLMTNT